MKVYRCKSLRVQDFLSRNGIQPIKIFEDTGAALYEFSWLLADALDRYYVKYVIFKG